MAPDSGEGGKEGESKKVRRASRHTYLGKYMICAFLKKSVLLYM